MSLNLNIVNLSFNAAIVNDLFCQRRDRNGLGYPGRRIPFGAINVEQRGNQLRESSDLATHAAESGLGIRCILHELGSEAEAREWRTQFVRDILQESSLGCQKGLYSVGHCVE